MQKLLALVLSVSILFSSVSPAWSQVREVSRGVIRGIRRIPSVQATQGMAPSVNSALTRRVYTQMVFANSTVQNRIATGQTVGLAGYILSLPASQRSKALRQDFMALSLLPHTISASERAQAGALLGENLSLAKAHFSQIYHTDLKSFLQEYTLHSSHPVFTQVQEVLADAAALAFLGTKEQSPVLLSFYEQAQGTLFEETAALITARGLLRMGAYEELSRFFAQQHSNSILAGTAAYIQLKGLPVEIPAALQQNSIPVANEKLAAFLGNPIWSNRLHADSSLEATRDWLSLQQPQTELVTKSEASQKTVAFAKLQPLPSASMNVNEVLSPVTPLVLSPLSGAISSSASAVTSISANSPAQEVKLPAAPRLSASGEGIVYSGIPVFAMMDTAKKAFAWVRSKFSKETPKKVLYEEPGLHENTVRPILAQVDMPAEASIGGDLIGVGNTIQEVSVGADGFKLTVEGTDKVEHILHNVDLTVSADLKNFSPEYNRLALDDNHIFELRNQTLPAKRPDHFYFALSIQNGEFGALMRGAKALNLSRPMRIKIQKTGSPKTSVTVPVFDEQFQEVPLVAEVDTSLLPGVKNPGKGNLWYRDNTLIFQEEEGVVIPLERAFVRLPKAESKHWTQIFKMNPQRSFHLTVLSTEGKMVPVTYLVPSLQTGLGKTLAPALHDMSPLGKDGASNVMLGINNVLPALMGLVHPLLKQYGEAAVFRVGASMFSAGGLIALLSGLYGHIGGGMMTNWQLAGFLTSSVLIALGTNITRFVQNLLMSANRGIVPQTNSFQKAPSVTETEPITYNASHLRKRAWEVLTKKSSKSLRDVVYYQRGAMFKNLGTMLFLSFPWLANLLGRAFGMDLGLDFSASYVPYTLYSLYTLRKVYKTRYKDAFPMNKTVLTNNLQDLQNSTAVDIAKVPSDVLTGKHPVLLGAAKQLKEAIDALVLVEARQLKTGINGLTIKHEQEVGQELEELLLLAGRTPQQAQRVHQNLQQAFDILGRRDVKWWKVAKMRGLPAALGAMTLATFGELGLSNGLAFAMREMLGNGTTATGIVGILLYGCMFSWRIVGNIMSQRMSGGSMYAVSSTAGVMGPALMALAMQSGNMGLLIGGAIMACFGISNFFSQMYEYMIGLYPKYKREIALLINYTMPTAALPVGLMKSDWFEGFGIPGLDMAICGAALAASVALTPGMLANSSIVRVLQNAWQHFKQAVKKWFHKGESTLPPPVEIPAQ